MQYTKYTDCNVNQGKGIVFCASSACLKSTMLVIRNWTIFDLKTALCYLYYHCALGVLSGVLSFPDTV